MTSIRNATQTQRCLFPVLETRTKFRLEFLRTAGTVVLQLSGQLDEAAASQLESEAQYWLNRGEKTLVLDVESVESIRRAGARSILMIGKLLEVTGGSLVLCGVYGLVRNIFAMYGVDGVFETFENLEEFETRTRSFVTH
jgi:anti-anti-sigma factor